VQLIVYMGHLGYSNNLTLSRCRLPSPLKFPSSSVLFICVRHQVLLVVKKSNSSAPWSLNLRNVFVFVDGLFTPLNKFELLAEKETNIFPETWLTGGVKKLSLFTISAKLA